MTHKAKTPLHHLAVRGYRASLSKHRRDRRLPFTRLESEDVGTNPVIIPRKLADNIAIALAKLEQLIDPDYAKAENTAFVSKVLAEQRQSAEDGVRRRVKLENSTASRRERRGLP